jgi:hypothetical protein
MYYWFKSSFNKIKVVKQGIFNKNKMKTIQDIRKSFAEKYNDYAEHLNELSILITRLAKETDELLNFMETTIKLREGLTPEPE